MVFKMKPMVIVVMGVSGAGKTTVGQLLAQALEAEFLDADDLHPAHNVEKMRRGIPLTDADRVPWLAAVRAAIERMLSANATAVVACSALKRAYRDEIVTDRSRVKIVYLKGTPELIARRLQGRTGHFMRRELLSSQFDALEEPADAIVVDVSSSPNEIVASICRQLGL